MEDNIKLISEQMLEQILQDQKVCFQFTMFINKLCLVSEIWSEMSIIVFSLLFQMLAVYFYDNTSSLDTKALKDLKAINADIDRENVILVRIAATGNNANSIFRIAEKFGVDTVPCLILFKYGKPHRFEGEITDKQNTIAWISEKLTS